MTTSLLLGAAEFWNALQQDIQQAYENIYVQTMSFEGDSVGQQLIEALQKSPATDKKLCIDSYSRFVINDSFIYPFSLFNKSLGAEVTETRRLITSLPDNGIQVRYTNPLGPCGIYYPARNHKKLIIIDNRICYLGGINFSEHNFEWFDLMVRIEDPSAATFLAEDFLATWQGYNQSLSERFDKHELFVLNGGCSETQFAELTRLLSLETRSLKVFSPYLTFPWVETLTDLANKGVDVTVFIPGNNNKPILFHYLLNALRHTKIKLRILTDQMFHLKAILINDNTLLTGSYNFDFVGRWAQQEVMLATKEKQVIDRFSEEVLKNFLENSQHVNIDNSNRLLGYTCDKFLKTGQGVCRLIARMKEKEKKDIG